MQPDRKRSGRKALLRLAAEAARVTAAAGNAAVCRAVAQALVADRLGAGGWRWIERHGVLPASPIDDLLVNDLIQHAAELGSVLDDPLVHFYEAYLQALDQGQRRLRGVFYTPREVVGFIIRAVDQLLCAEFGLRDGLADVGATWLRILDPALGAGVFLTEIIAFVHGRQVASEDETSLWQSYVDKHLLGRLGGIEIIPEAAYLALVRIAQTLEATGYTFTASTPLLSLVVGDALATPIRPAWSIIVGNPPFSGVSEAKHPWLHKLLHGVGADNQPRANYFQVDGQPLGERKHWLQDDYVKFLRVAHEQIETTGVGIVALVTSHGYLENVTFAGLREQLEQTFPRITTIDLHGNAKRRERTPAGQRDENVFGIEQGVAIGLFRRPPAASVPIVERGDVWGTREQKLAFLATATCQDLGLEPVGDRSSGRVWSIHRAETCPEYDAGWSLTEIFPVNSTAPVTARDDFVVGWNAAELLERCRDLADPSLTDEAIRTRHFQKTRSKRYPPGDTRGWKLPAARARMREQANYGDLLQRVQYRPLDWRPMLWAPWLIDWRREEVMSHVVSTGNVTLIARRQSPPQAEWNYVWVTSGLTLDGVIRSDNCGSESLFPLWLTTPDGSRQANLDARFQAEVESITGQPCEPQSVLHYIYALLHALAYRSRYRLRLERAFPRIPLPTSLVVWHSLAAHGEHLLRLHTSEPTSSAATCWQIAGEPVVEAGYPKHVNHTVFINSACSLSKVPAAVWDYRIGSHQVARKFLKDRRGRTLTDEDLTRYAHIVSVLAETLTQQAAIDLTLQENGGIPQVFSATARS